MVTQRGETNCQLKTRVGLHTPHPTFEAWEIKFTKNKMLDFSSILKMNLKQKVQVRERNLNPEQHSEYKRSKFDVLKSIMWTVVTCSFAAALLFRRPQSTA
jgi:hypothetical protein